MIPGYHYPLFLGDKMVARLLLDLTHLVFTGKALISSKEKADPTVISPQAIELTERLRARTLQIAEPITLGNFRDSLRDAEDYLWAVEARREARKVA